ncbi:hypothetical protein MCOR25_000780 [Pyricularia grisea]|uniref:Urease accessory protein UreF n=1 Tax=Pyricularia grisea TaxID=148305 RepID=A0A6P8B9S4_PYRGI
MHLEQEPGIPGLDSGTVQSDYGVSVMETNSIEAEIHRLEAELEDARRRLDAKRPRAVRKRTPPSPNSLTAPFLPPSTHHLLLLTDSALPLGAFAFSSGLESFLAHSPKRPASSPFSTFLPLSISSFASTTLPFTLAAHRDPSRLLYLDDALDASLVCTVARRASVSQGRALIGLWERCFAPSLPPDRDIAEYVAAVKAPARQHKPVDCITNAPPSHLPRAAAHLAPLFGAVCAAAGLSAHQAAFVLVLGHVKALASAAVRAGVFGPYQAQRLLAGDEVRRLVDLAVQREWDTEVEDACQTVPVMDLWVGRHELLYSRIFNS